LGTAILLGNSNFLLRLFEKYPILFAFTIAVHLADSMLQTYFATLGQVVVTNMDIHYIL